MSDNQRVAELRKDYRKTIGVWERASKSSGQLGTLADIDAQPGAATAAADATAAAWKNVEAAKSLLDAARKLYIEELRARVRAELPDPDTRLDIFNQDADGLWPVPFEEEDDAIICALEQGLEKSPSAAK